MPEEGARLTSLGKVISALLIVGLLGLGVWVARLLKQLKDREQNKPTPGSKA